ncbi:glycoside hydrolase family 15 protein [Paractinoplanes brasiliensis]|uniref:GH15 family glucan-1,4-alpha-glucosidase n=1 Tax=Paractinoplanes brasiliensis TaxID=52695 RepID=A0A4R6JBN6_9ACTN|nr:glycoside hydrolase family 15 protein [Actinoplanes brasiliensis]TDO32687.1 GH15 family glucan-1,4-alpha-glucosidase [Actinoplanes brasiliensis]GID32820.1 glucoamylase [Actinoplanes brasiliensis]
MANDYPLIADHGLIGDMQTSALVSTDGCIDWFCSPRFDSPSIFGALLDARRGGHFRIRPTAPVVTSKQLYLPDTAVLITRFLTDSGVGEVIDFMRVVDSTTATEDHRLIRMVRCVRGEMSFAVDIAPRFDYGRESSRTHISQDGVVFEGPRTAVSVCLVSEPDDERLARTWADEAGDVHAELRLTAGQMRGLSLQTGPPGPIRRIPVDEVWQLFHDTVRFWTTWVSRSTYTGRWRETLHRSAITLKLMTYAPTGAMVAAPTAALPEQIGGERNWDYRYTWVRDASFSVYSLLGMGFTDEAAALGRWLRDRVDEGRGKNGSGPLNIMYRVDGSSDLSEETLPSWSGYRGSAPVRIGNGAAGQLQLDIYGEAMDSIYFADRHGAAVGHQGWERICDLLDWVTVNWDQPEEGIWETRGGRQDFTYGRLMSWLALDRGIRMAAEHGRPAGVERWRIERDAVYRQIMTRGWSPQRRAFRQHYGTDVLDAALLRMPTVGFIAPKDPMWISTLAAMDEELVIDSLVYRYDPAASPDGLRGSEGTFSLCTFAYVSALARAGQVNKARVTFEKMLTYANHLGLYSEEIGLTGEQLGNFPQAFTHLALIDAGIALDSELDRRR